MFGEDLLLIQDNVQELTAALASAMANQTPLNVPLVLTGVAFSVNPGNTTATGGWIAWKGELFQLAPAVLNVSVLADVRLYIASESLRDFRYKDGGGAEPIRERRFIAMNTANFVNDLVTNNLLDVADVIDPANLKYINADSWIVVAEAGGEVANGWFVPEVDGLNFKFRRIGNFIEISGIISRSTAITSPFLYQLPVGYRPPEIVSFIGLVSLGAIPGFAPFFIQPNGQILLPIENIGGATSSQIRFFNTVVPVI